MVDKSTTKWSGEEKVGDDGKEEEEEPKVPAKEVFKRIMREVPGVKCFFYVGAAGGVLAGGSMGLFALFFGEMIAVLNAVNVRAESWKILALFMFMGTSLGFFTFIQFWIYIRFAMRVGSNLRIRYYKALMRSEMTFFADESSGGLSGRLNTQAKLIELGLGNQLGQTFQSIGMIIGGFVVAFYESWLFTFILLALTPVISIGGAIAGKIISNLSKEGTDIYKAASARSQEILAGILTVQSLTAEPGEEVRFKELISGAKPLVQKKALMVGGAMGSMQFINMGLFYGIGMYLGALQIAEWFDSKDEYGVSHDGFSPDEVFASFFGIFIAGFGIGTIVAALPDVLTGLAACQNLFNVIDRVPIVRPPDGGAEPIKKKIKGNITLRNLTFAYPSRQDVEVLQNINMEIKSGQTVAFVGPSGCGKSTIISLLERFYDPKSGKILIDGTPIWNLDLDNWRSQIGYVGQEPVLFDGTIEENILLGTGGQYGLEDVKKAAIQANAHDFVSRFPDGYQTKVGEGGSWLSGGQKQRISIARALVRDPQILLLDEATSALDTESEKVVQEALDRILATGERTCCVIAHRLSTITNADMIFVFQAGRIVQMGSYKELASDQTGVFYTMVKAQDVLGAGALKPTMRSNTGRNSLLSTARRSMLKQSSQRSAGTMERQNSNSTRSMPHLF